MTHFNWEFLTMCNGEKFRLSRIGLVWRSFPLFCVDWTLFFFFRISLNFRHFPLNFHDFVGFCRFFSFLSLRDQFSTHSFSYIVCVGNFRILPPVDQSSAIEIGSYKLLDTFSKFFSLSRLAKRQNTMTEQHKRKDWPEFQCTAQGKGKTSIKLFLWFRKLLWKIHSN